MAEQTKDTAAAPKSEAERSSVPRPEERIAALEADIKELTDRMLRIAADCENWKKRARKELDGAVQRERDAALLDRIEVVDLLERALGTLDQAPDPRSVRDGVEMALHALRQDLDRRGATRLEARGRPFDPSVHDAIAKAPSTEVSPGNVLAEVRPGYRVGDRLLRPASVVVAESPVPTGATAATSGESS